MKQKYKTALLCEQSLHIIKRDQNNSIRTPYMVAMEAKQTFTIHRLRNKSVAFLLLSIENVTSLNVY